MKRFLPPFSGVRNATLGVAALGVLAVYLIPFHAGALGQITQQECSLGRFIDHTYNNGSQVPPDAAGGNTGSTVAQAAFALPAASRNLIVNPGIEQTAGSQPAAWLSNVYGTNDAKFSLNAAAHTGKLSLGVTISKYSSGDADWYYLPISVIGGGYYQYDDFYQSNVSTPVILEAVDASGTSTYINLTGAAPAGDWTHYSVRFFVPQGTVKATVFHALTAKGYLHLDDASLAPADLSGFSTGMVSLTFDDGWLSTYTNAVPLLRRQGIVSTQYLISGYLDAPNYMSVKDVYRMQASGDEIASHTVNHLDLTSQSPQTAKRELTQSKRQLSACFGEVSDFAPPYGTYNPKTTEMAKAQYASQRSTETGFNTADSFNPYDIKVQNVTNATTEQQLQEWLDMAKNNHLWLVLVYHQVDRSGSQYSRSIDDFKTDLETIKQSNLPIFTVSQALNNINSHTE